MSQKPTTVRRLKVSVIAPIRNAFGIPSSTQLAARALETGIDRDRLRGIVEDLEQFVYDLTCRNFPKTER